MWENLNAGREIQCEWRQAFTVVASLKPDMYGDVKDRRRDVTGDPICRDDIHRAGENRNLFLAESEPDSLRFGIMGSTRVKTVFRRFHRHPGSNQVLGERSI